MRHILLDQLIEIMTEANSLDFNNAPAVRFMALLRDKLMAEGFNRFEAEEIVSVMEVEIKNDSVPDEDMETLTTLYCDIIVKVHKALIDNEFSYPMTSLLQASRKFSLKLS